MSLVGDSLLISQEGARNEYVVQTGTTSISGVEVKDEGLLDNAARGKRSLVRIATNFALFEGISWLLHDPSNAQALRRASGDPLPVSQTQTKRSRLGRYARDSASRVCSCSTAP